MPAFRLKKSTIVRAKMAGFQIAFRSFERLAPELGGRLALRLWCTPTHATRTEQAGAPGVRRHIPVHGAAVLAESWGTGPRIYLLHGWGGHRHQLAALVDPLVAAGHQVVAFDALGHGDSPPGPLGHGRATLPEFADALTAVVAAYGPAHAVVAHSLGAAATAIAVLDGLPATRLALIAPVSDPTPQTRLFARAFGFGDRVHSALHRRIEEVAGRPMSDFDIPARAAARPDLPPLLVLHDAGDRQVHHANGTAISTSWPEAELITTEGLGHQRILTDASVVAAVVDFVASRDRAGRC